MPKRTPTAPSHKAATPGWWLFAAIVGATFLAYLPVLHAGFIWNDVDYVTKPSLRSLGGLWRIWFEFGATEQYYPVLHSAFWVEHALWGDSSGAYHFLNVALHAASACLLMSLLRRLSVPGAFLAAMLFALHPVFVESAAWISEEKNTLSLVFYLWAALVYLGFDERRSRASYVGATALFLLAILSKSVTATLPAALLVVFWWKRGRLDWKRDAVPLIPWIVLSAAMGMLSAWVEHTYVGAQGEDFDLSLIGRVLLSGRVIWFYLFKLLWPASLIFIYPRWTVDTGVLWQWLFPIGAIGLAGALWAIRARTRAPLAAYLLFVGSLFPTIGFFNVFAFKFSYVADHWNYLPGLGLLALAAAGATWAIDRIPLHLRAWGRVGAGAVVVVFGLLSWRQCGGYSDMETFYLTILRDNPDCWLALNNMGKLELERQRPDAAVPYFEKTIRLRPKDPEPQNNIGVALSQVGRDAEALAHYKEAIRIEPRHADAFYNMGNLYMATGHPAEAMDSYTTSLRLNPLNPGAEHNLGVALSEMGRNTEALGHYDAALAIDPNRPVTNFNAGLILFNDGRNADAVARFQRAVALDPNYVDAHFKLALALFVAGHEQEALAENRIGNELKTAAAARAGTAK